MRVPPYPGQLSRVVHRVGNASSAPAVLWTFIVFSVLYMVLSPDRASAASPVCVPTRADSLGHSMSPRLESETVLDRDWSSQGSCARREIVTPLGERRLSGGLRTRMATMMTHIVLYSRPALMVATSTPPTFQGAIPVGHHTSMCASLRQGTVHWSPRSIHNRHRPLSVWISSLSLNSLSRPTRPT